MTGTRSAPTPGMATAVTMRPYQVQAIAAVFEAWLAGARSVLIESATGTGKTSVVAKLIADLLLDGLDGVPVHRVLFMAHRFELIDQAAERFREFGLEVGVERSGSWSDGEAVVVASVQTLMSRGGARLSSFPRDAFDVVITDEGHHCTSNSYRAVYHHFTDARLLLVTATPDRADGVSLATVADVCAFRYGIADAVRDGWLVPARGVRVEVPGLDLSKVRQKRITLDNTSGDVALRGKSTALTTPEDGWMTDAAAHTAASRAGTADAESRDLHQGDLARACIIPEVVAGTVGPLLELAGTKRTIVFAVDRAHAWALTKALRARGATADMVDGKMKKKHRAKVFASHRSGEVHYLVNVMVACEGYDDQSIECVAMCRPTQSRVLFSQCVGRALRLLGNSIEESHSRGKLEGLILDFVGVGCRFSLVGPEDVLAGAMVGPVEVIKTAKASAARPLDDAPVAPAGPLSYKARAVDLMRKGGKALKGFLFGA